MCQIFKHCRCNTSDSVLSKMHREHLCRRSPVKSPAMFFYKTSGKLKPLMCTLLLSLSISLSIWLCRGAEDPLLYHMFALLLSGGRACVALCSSMGAARMRSPWPAVTLLYRIWRRKKKQSQVNLWTTEVCSNHRGEFFLNHPYVKVLGHLKIGSFKAIVSIIMAIIKVSWVRHLKSSTY